jgi:anti-sigma B factor antagonist
MSASAAPHPRFSITAAPPAVDAIGLAVSGEVDIATAPQLRTALADAIGRSPRGVELDLRDCSFIDSTGLQVIVRGAVALAEQGGWLSLSRPPDRLRRLFETAGIDHIAGIRLPS